MTSEDIGDVISDLPPAVRRHVIEMLLSEMLRTTPELIDPLAELLRDSAGVTEPLVNGLHRLRSSSYQGVAPSLSRGKPVDILVLAIKPVELDACLAAFGVSSTARPQVLGKSGICAWTAKASGLRLGIAMVGTAGNVETANVLSAINRETPFRAAVLVGMCAGVRGEVQLGHVIVSEVVHAYEFRLMTDEGPKFEPKAYTPPEIDFRSVMTLKTQGQDCWADVLKVLGERDLEFPQDETETIEAWRPDLKRAGLLAGGMLVEDGSLPTFAYDIHSRICGAEMEGAGFAAACEELDKPWLVFRGVADYGEPERRKHWQWPATYAAASILKVCLADRLVFQRILG